MNRKIKAGDILYHKNTDRLYVVNNKKVCFYEDDEYYEGWLDSAYDIGDEDVRNVFTYVCNLQDEDFIQDLSRSLPFGELSKDAVSIVPVLNKVQRDLNKWFKKFLGRK
jgi:hypothetical protein